MKKYFVLATALLAFATNVLSAPIDREKALKSAQEFLTKSRKGGPRLAPAQTHLQEATTTQGDAYYAFNIGQEQGFVIVSGDDRTPPILGYVEEGSFDASQIPDNMKVWLQGYERQIAWLQAHQDHTPETQTGEEREAVSPLVNCHWDQGEPFNNMCPFYTSTDRCVTGCTATAMAQVIYYHRRPKATTDPIPAYYTTSYNFYREEMPVTTIDWDNLLPSYEGDEPEDAINAVSTLMALCGQSIKVDYGPRSSGAVSSLMAIALRKYFNFAPSTHFIERDNYRLEEWENIIYQELAEGRPVLYGGMSSGGGHEFVVDGYDRDGLFHINWGWGGMSDGYFLLSVLNSDNTQGAGASSSNDGYSYDQDAIVGITPYDELPVPSNVLTIQKIDLRTSQTTYTRQTDGGFHPMVRADFFNMTGETGTFSVGLLILDAEGNICESYPVKEVTLGPNQGYRSSNMGDQRLAFQGLPNGRYSIALGSCLKDSEEGLMPCDGSLTFSIQADLSGNVLTLQLPQVNLTGTLAPEGDVEEGMPFKLNIEMTNNGTDFSRDVYVLVDGEEKGGFRMEIAGGTSATFTFEMGGLTQGDKTVELAYKDENGNNIIIASGNITVTATEQGEPHLVFNVSIEELTDNNILPSGKATVKMELTNDGNGNFNNRVGAMLLLRNGNKYSTYGDTPTTNLFLRKGESTTLTFVFRNLPNNSDFMVYRIQGNTAQSANIRFSTNFSQQGIGNNDLDVDINIAGLDDRQRLQGQMAKGMVALTNINAEIFVGKVWMKLLKWDSESSEWVLQDSDAPNMEISAGETQKVAFAFNGLEDKTKYTLEVSYQKNAEEIAQTSQTFRTNFDGTEDEPEEKTADVNGDGTIDTLDIAAVMSAIYGEYNEAADLYDDGRIDIADIWKVIEAMTTQTTNE